jgi:hypothetical protein
MRRIQEPKTAGERLLARYFTDVRGWQAVSEWDYEPLFEERRRRPDFRLRLGGWRCMLEVKEFGPSGAAPAAGGEAHARRGRHDRIASKIHAGRRQLREFHEDHLCAVVLVSGATPDTDVDDPAVTMGALVGDPLLLARSCCPETRRLIDPPVPAVLVLRVHPGGGLGVTIHENPLAPRTFPSHLFQGPWDTVWSARGGDLSCEFSGAALRAPAPMPPAVIAA